MILGEIKCPMCRGMFDSLNFWRAVSGIYYHLCAQCCVSDKNEDDLLRIGYTVGMSDTFNLCEEEIINLKHERLGG